MSPATAGAGSPPSAGIGAVSGATQPSSNNVSGVQGASLPQAPSGNAGQTPPVSFALGASQQAPSVPSSLPSTGAGHVVQRQLDRTLMEAAVLSFFLALGCAVSGLALSFPTRSTRR